MMYYLKNKMLHKMSTDISNDICVMRKIITDEKKQMSTDISNDICANLASFNLRQSVTNAQDEHR